MNASNIREYIFSRVKRPDYRGVHIAQHNRLTFGKAFPVLSAIHSVACGSAFAVPPDPEMVKAVGSTSDAIKKVFFPDFGRMGLLDRMDKDGRVIPPRKQMRVSRARLTEVAVRLVSAEGAEARRMYEEAAERLVKSSSKGEEVMEVMRFALDKFNELSVWEYMLILSDLDLSKEQAANLVEQYRALGESGRKSLRRDVEQECERISAKAYDKGGKRDFGNWLNEANSAFVVLDATGHFTVQGRGRKATIELRPR